MDASALICLIRSEPGSDIVMQALPESCISAVNLAEVISKISDLDMDRTLIESVVATLDLDVIAFGAGDAHDTGLLREPSRQFGLSLGDRACLALTARLNATALTTDRAWANLNHIAQVKLLR
nr:type II toxin-antitoxin system VapC family toxin [Sphingobium boeckii]